MLSEHSNSAAIVAAVLLIGIASIHSLIGERLIFRKVRKSLAIGQTDFVPLTESNLRIIWASWHIVSVIGVAVALFVISLVRAQAGAEIAYFYFAISMFLSSALVFGSTRGKHAGWVGLLAVGLLLMIAAA